MFGNPITGYSTPYYSNLIEMQRELNDNEFREVIKDDRSKDREYNLPRDNNIKYNRMQNK